PGVVTSPAVAADVTVRLRLAPNSDPSQMIDQTVSGRANRFGYFHSPAGALVLGQAGEYRVDVTASYIDDQGQLWMGSRTWGGVVAPSSPAIVAHGREGINNGLSTIGPEWFFRTDTGVPIGGNHIPFPYYSGDVTWQQKSDAAMPVVTFEDPLGSLT